MSENLKYNGYTDYLENRIRELEEKLEKEKQKKPSKQLENNTGAYTSEQVLLNE